MMQIDNIDKIELLNSTCLIQVDGIFTDEGIFQEQTKGGIYVGGEIYKYNKGKQAIRTGILRKMPDRLEKNRQWETDYFPKVNSRVWFDFVYGSEAQKVQYKDNIYILLNYKYLFVSKLGNDVRMLNGYLLGQKVKIPDNPLWFKDQYYDDIYEIKYDGKPNLSYKDEQYVDDPLIKTGMIVMTRASSYPKLEQNMYAEFSKEDYYLFQRKDVVSIIEF